MPNQTVTPTSRPSTSRRRGRPVGTYKHGKDKSWLMQAARFVNTGHAASPRQAFAMLTDEDDAAIRRLQRRWEKDGEELLRMDRIVHRERCENEYRNLRGAFPKLWARISQFVGSPAGKRYLKTYARADGHPIHPMALGIAVLMDAVEDYERKREAAEAKRDGSSAYLDELRDPTSRSQANNRRFDRALEGWFTGNLAITPTALRALADRAHNLADALEADLKQDAVQ